MRTNISHRAGKNGRSLAEARSAQDRRLGRVGINIVFWDDFDFSFQEPFATTGARRCKRPLFHRVITDRPALSRAVALTLSGEIILIWDRAQSHRSKIVLPYLHNDSRIRIEELPAYAPEPIQKSIVMAMSSKVSRMLGQPGNKMLVRGFARLRQRPDLVLAFSHIAGLSVRKLRLT